MNGGIYVLNCGISSILMDTATSTCTGVVTHSGQRISCKYLLLPSHMGAKQPLKIDLSHDKKNPGAWVSRGVCITDRSLLGTSGQLLAVLQPGSVNDSPACVHVMQVGPPSCPDGRYAGFSYVATQDPKVHGY